MGWLGDPLSDATARYFSAFPGECGERYEGSRIFGAFYRTVHGVEYAVPRTWALRNVSHERCNVRQGQSLDWCITHWMPLAHAIAVQPKALPSVACEHCSLMHDSKGLLKKHMQKVHKDILLSRRFQHAATKRGLL